MRDSSYNRQLTKERLLARQKRLRILMNVDVPKFREGKGHSPDSTQRLEGVLADYSQTIELWLGEIERNQTKNKKSNRN